MLLGRMKEGKKLQQQGRHLSNELRSMTKSHQEVNQNVSPSEIKEALGKEWLHFQMEEEMLHLEEKHRSGKNN